MSTFSTAKRPDLSNCEWVLSLQSDVLCRYNSLGMLKLFLSIAPMHYVIEEAKPVDAAAELVHFVRDGMVLSCTGAPRTVISSFATPQKWLRSDKDEIAAKSSMMTSHLAIGWAGDMCLVMHLELFWYLSPSSAAHRKEWHHPRMQFSLWTWGWLGVGEWLHKIPMLHPNLSDSSWFSSVVISEGRKNRH